MVMDLHGSDLEYMFNKCNKKFTLKTTIMIAEQILDRIEFLHSNDFTHRVIKPKNFLIGVDNL